MEPASGCKWLPKVWTFCWCAWIGPPWSPGCEHQGSVLFQGLHARQVDDLLTDVLGPQSPIRDKLVTGELDGQLENGSLDKELYIMLSLRIDYMLQLMKIIPGLLNLIFCWKKWGAWGARSRNTQGFLQEHRRQKTYIHILAPVKAEFVKRIKIVDFRGGGMIAPPRDKLFQKYPGTIRIKMGLNLLVLDWIFLLKIPLLTHHCICPVVYNSIVCMYIM